MNGAGVARGLHRKTADGLRATRDRLLVFGGWLLAISYWLLAAWVPGADDGEVLLCLPM
jgi:hypothetical protein